MYTNNIQVTTKTDPLKGVIDTVLGTNVALTRILGAAKPWKGGLPMKQTIKYASNNNVTYFSGGDLLPTGDVDNHTTIEFDPAFVTNHLVIFNTEKTLNESTGGSFNNLVDMKMEDAAIEMANQLGTDFYTGLGTGKTLNGLANIIDDGTVAATYGGKSRATYTTLQATVLPATTNKLTLAEMDELHDAVSSGSRKPTIIFTTKAIFSLYSALLSEKERYMIPVGDVKGGYSLKGSATGLGYRGIAVVADEKCPDETLYMVNEDEIDFYAVDYKSAEGGVKKSSYTMQLEGSSFEGAEGLGFHYTPWKIPVNQESAVCRIILAGQILSKNPKRHGKMTGIQGI